MNRYNTDIITFYFGRLSSVEEFIEQEKYKIFSSRMISNFIEQKEEV